MLRSTQTLYITVFLLELTKVQFLIRYLLNGFYVCSYTYTSEPFPLSKKRPIASNNITFMNSNLKNCIIIFETEKNVYNCIVQT